MDSEEQRYSFSTALGNSESLSRMIILISGSQNVALRPPTASAPPGNVLELKSQTEFDARRARCNHPCVNEFSRRDGCQVFWAPLPKGVPRPWEKTSPACGLRRLPRGESRGERLLRRPGKGPRKGGNPTTPLCQRLRTDRTEFKGKAWFSWKFYREKCRMMHYVLTTSI